MKSTIHIAQAARSAQALGKNIRYNNRIMSITDYLQALINEGCRPVIGEKSRIQYNRNKYNRMTSTKEQDEYIKKCDEKVIEYQAVYPAGSWVELTKTEYDYLTSLYFPTEEDTTGPEYCTEEELKHLFKLEHVNIE